MSPEFRDLVGEEGTPEELERLRGVHELLSSVDAPPELPRRLAHAPRPRARVVSLPRPRVQAALGLAAAAAIAIGFGIGYGVRGGGFPSVRTTQMHGVGQLASASASLELGKRDAAGNWPLEMVVRGLPALPHDGWYELRLTKHGKPDASCGTFRTSGGQVARVRLNAPYDLREYDGWVVVAHVPHRSNRLLLTT
jgi:hypothetical protein